MVDRPQLAPAAGPAAATPGDAARARAEETAQNFEAVFLQQMLSAMRQGLAEDSPIGGPDSEFGSMLVAEQAKLISRAGGIGVADKILAELLKLQEAR